MALAVAFAIALLSGVVVGGGVRYVFGRRTHLSWSASVLSGMVGAFLSITFGILAVGSPQEFHPIWALILAVAGTAVVMWIATRLSRPPERSARELIDAGEAADVEFKSTARCNLHTRQRDDKLELVIAKTVAAFANSEGGSLLIGVSDEGEALGLEPDLQFMKQRDNDRYELWLRDFLSQVIGGAATASLKVSFPDIGGTDICLVRVPVATRPVYVVPKKGEGPQLWVRVGNSSRQLPLDQALAYASDRWGRRRLRVSQG